MRREDAPSPATRTQRVRRIYFPRAAVGVCLLIIAKPPADKSADACPAVRRIVCHSSLLPIITLIVRHLHLLRGSARIFTYTRLVARRASRRMTYSSYTATLFFFNRSHDSQPVIIPGALSLFHRTSGGHRATMCFIRTRFIPSRVTISRATISIRSA